MGWKIATYLALILAGYILHSIVAGTPTASLSFVIDQQENRTYVVRSSTAERFMNEVRGEFDPRPLACRIERERFYEDDVYPVPRTAEECATIE